MTRPRHAHTRCTWAIVRVLMDGARTRLQIAEAAGATPNVVAKQLAAAQAEGVVRPHGFAPKAAARGPQALLWGLVR